MERTNKPIRDVFSGINPNMNYGKDVCLQMMEKVGQNPSLCVCDRPGSDRWQQKDSRPSLEISFQGISGVGPEFARSIYNMMLILFAGHDTTAHTMTWLTYEMAKNPQFQQKLHEECDAFFARLNGRPMEYEDCEHLPYLTRCVMETLRFWTAVPAGTHRQLQFDDYVKGPDGTEVRLPKGTYKFKTGHDIAIQNYGAKMLMFLIRKRFFEMTRFGEGRALKVLTHRPIDSVLSHLLLGDCLGKNFAQMEMRTILANVFINTILNSVSHTRTSMPKRQVTV